MANSDLKKKIENGKIIADLEFTIKKQQEQIKRLKEINTNNSTRLMRLKGQFNRIKRAVCDFCDESKE